jgi:group II intron reverse transcriptase/maturase
MERRDTRLTNQFKLKPNACPDGHYKGYYGLNGINLAAVKNPQLRFNNLSHHLNEGNLLQAFRRLDGSKAVGIDHVTKSEYQKSLWTNIQNLDDKIAKGGWRPQPSREVLIPKPQGGTRPLAVGCLEDKIVQNLVAKILEAIYEPKFYDVSHGFRPGKSTHDALHQAYQLIDKCKKNCVVVEMDLEKYFNTIDHDLLMNFIEQSISDPHFLRLLRRMLRNSILSEDGIIRTNEIGTPQGSPVSPILSNIFLHYVLDDWFKQNWEKQGKIIRYADDAIFIFEDKAVAEEFKTALEERLSNFKVKLNQDKSGIKQFHYKAPKGDIPFLGFVFYWGKQRLVKSILKLKTAPKKLAKSIQDFKEWLKQNRNRLRTKKIWEGAASRLRGHYNYYGLSFNTPKLNHYYVEVTKLLYKWLNRRSQKRSYSWAEFQRKLRYDPLPKPPTLTEVIDITDKFGNRYDSKLKRKPKSRMRENRKYGSERSRGTKLPLFT